MLIVPPFISIFTRYTFLISGRFLHPLHKHFGRKISFFFSMNSFSSSFLSSNNSYSFSFNDVIGLAIEGFNRKESGLFFTYSMIKLIFANNYSLCLGGPFFGRFYTADPNQRKKFESLHAVLCSIFNLSSSSFPDDHQFYYLQEINNCISAVKSNLVIKPITDDNFLPILPLDYFERSFISITRKFHLTLNMADSNSFVTIFLGLGA